MAARVVVGTDGSATALQAVRWAAGEAHRRGAMLHVVRSWEPPTFGTVPPAGEPAGATQAEAALADAIERALGAGPYPVPIIRTAVQGPPGRRLAEVAAGADLLVIGSHLVTGGEVPLGPVGRQVLRQAPCPVVVVPAALPVARVAS